jgi:choline kinase
MKKYYCVDCKKEVSEKRVKRCRHCAHLSINFSSSQIGKRSIALKGRKFTKETIDRMKESKVGHIPWNKGLVGFKGYWLGKSNKDINIVHHIDSDKTNNTKSNFLRMKQGKHRSLHWKCYNYLIVIGEVNNYLKEFFKKYSIVDVKDNIDSKVVHHVDCNRENNIFSNLLYLKDKKIHNKLHQESYKYLVRINKVNDYISWFLLNEEEKLPKTETIEELKKS